MKKNEKKLYKRRIVKGDVIQDVLFYSTKAEEILPVGCEGISQWESNDFGSIEFQDECGVPEWAIETFKTHPVENFELA